MLKKVMENELINQDIEQGNKCPAHTYYSARKKSFVLKSPLDNPSTPSDTALTYVSKGTVHMKQIDYTTYFQNVE